MTDQKRRMVMDIVAPPSSPEQPLRPGSESSWLKRLFVKLHMRINKAATQRPAARPALDDQHPATYNIRRDYVRLAFMCLIVALAVVGWLIYQRINTGPIPRKYRQGLTYTLYYPTNLPAGYHVNTSSFARHGDVLIYSIVASDGQNIAVSEEPKPSNLDLGQTPYSTGIALPDQRAFTTGAGSAEISLWGNRLVSSLVTNNTWVILNVTGFQMNAAQQVTQAFTQVN